jgi:hypothetical protein
MYGANALTDSTAFKETAISRIGHHNDAFLASPNDYGTYSDIATEYPYLTAETNFVPMGGENDNYAPPRSDCSKALEEMGKFHWSYINNGYFLPTLNAWESQGCMDTMKKNLGYRFVLQEASYPTSASPGEAVNISLKIKNEGFASPYNSRPVFIVLYNSSNTYKIVLNSDPRTWKSGSTTTLNQSITIPANITPGVYKLGLWLPDKSSSLQSKPSYSIRLANTSMWDATLGFNKLSAEINITTSGDNPTPKPGDLDGDSHINYVDFNLLITNFGNPYTIFDFNDIVSNYGK